MMMAMSVLDILNGGQKRSILVTLCEGDPAQHRVSVQHRAQWKEKEIKSKNKIISKKSEKTRWRWWRWEFLTFWTEVKNGQFKSLYVKVTPHNTESVFNSLHSKKKEIK